MLVYTLPILFYLDMTGTVSSWTSRLFTVVTAFEDGMQVNTEVISYETMVSSNFRVLISSATTFYAVEKNVK